MARKFIPDSDRAFADMARGFVLVIAQDRATYNFSADAIEHANRLVKQYRSALAIHLRPSTSTEVSRVDKDGARKQAEEIVRSFGRAIRGDDCITPTAKLAVGIHERPRKLHRRDCPKLPPYVRFVGPSKDPRKHVLSVKSEFSAQRRKKPLGAARVEVFLEFVRPGAPIPKVPRVLRGGCPGYLRSFTTSRIEVEFPVPSEPMLLVYWGRWADAKGEVGPFSRPAVARIEYAADGLALPPSQSSAMVCAGDVADDEPITNSVRIIPPAELPAGQTMEPKHSPRYLLTARELRECYVEREERSLPPGA